MSTTVRSQSSSDPKLVAKYTMSENFSASMTKWQDSKMYQTSYFKQSENNEPALRNSTEQFLKSKSNQLQSITPREEFYRDKVHLTNFIVHDHNNLYRTTYTDMSNKLPKLLNYHYIPNFKGFVPGMKSENPFASSFSKLAHKSIENFDMKRFAKDQYEKNTYDWKYNPMSKSIGNKKSEKLDQAVRHHYVTDKLRDSGYTFNHSTCDGKGWNPDKLLHSDMNRTEYRIHINPKKNIHYKNALFSTGKLKKKEYNYKHT